MGDLSDVSLMVCAGCSPSPMPEDYHLPEGYCFYSYDKGDIGTQPVTNMSSEYLRTYIIGRLSGITEPEDELICTITDGKAVLSGSVLEDYLDTNAQLMMAAYDGNGRFLGIQDGISRSDDGPYQMIVEAEGIETVRFFVMDGSYMPLELAHIFE